MVSWIDTHLIPLKKKSRTLRAHKLIANPVAKKSAALISSLSMSLGRDGEPGILDETGLTDSLRALGTSTTPNLWAISKMDWLCKFIFGVPGSRFGP